MNEQYRSNFKYAVYVISLATPASAPQPLASCLFRTAEGAKVAVHDVLKGIMGASGDPGTICLIGDCGTEIVLRTSAVSGAYMQNIETLAEFCAVRDSFIESVNKGARGSSTLGFGR